MPAIMPGYAKVLGLVRNNRVTLALIIFCGAGVHVAMHGGKLLLSLYAIALGGDSFTVGLLLALFGLLPLFIAIPAGRWVDRIGALRPIVCSCLAILAGFLIAAAVPSIAALCIGAFVQGGGTMIIVIALNNLTGALGGPEDRAANFGWLALGYAIGMLAGPFSAGAGIDLLGHRATVVVFALGPLSMLAVLGYGQARLPRVTKAPPMKGKRLFDLFGHSHLRGIFVLSAAVSTSYELHGFLAPVYGNRIGLSASTIGALGSAVALGVFTVRTAAPYLLRRVSEWRLIGAALISSGLLYVMFVQLTSVPLLLLVSFLIGLAMGITQPVSMSLLHNAAPAGRTGEALGLRTMIMTFMQSATQLSLGTMAGAAGLVPVTWAVAAALIYIGGYAERRARARS